MKKPHALIGLLAAAGTTIGVLVALFGLPYGRMNYTAFAGLYHNGGTPATAMHVETDCDQVAPGIQDNCNVPASSTRVLDVIFVNNSGASVTVGAFNFSIISDNTSVANASAPSDANMNFNPNFDETGVGATGSWACTPPTPTQFPNDPAAGQNRSFLSCFVSDAGPTVATGTSLRLVTMSYNMGAGPVGTANISFSGLQIGDNDGVELLSCNPVSTTAGDCFGAALNIVPEPTATPTNTATATNTATNTPTATPTPLGASVVKIPEGNENNVDLAIPAANLWICVTGPCAGPGEGNLIVFEYAFNVLTGDQNGDTITDGLGAYEFSVEYDNFVIQSVNPSDVVFNPGPIAPYPGGADGVLDGEGAARAPASCGFSLIFENVVHFGCVTAGQTPGPTGDMDIARLNLIPHPDLTNDIFPGNDNGVVTVLKDNGCELVDVFGHPVTGSVGGGLTPVCGDLAVTVRILEGDLNLDCVVDVQDQQLIAWRYGAFFGSLLYSQWYDLEPNLHDLDIDIKDIQKVFGRDGSTCQIPIQPQPPLGPPAPFGN